MSISIDTSNKAIDQDTESTLTKAEQRPTGEDSFAEHVLFDRLLDSPREQHQPAKNNQGMHLSPQSFTPNSSIITVQNTLNTSSVTTAASTQANVANTAQTSPLFSQVVTQVSGALSSLMSMQLNVPQSFTLLIPGQANLTVNATMMLGGVRSLQLESDELKFQTWLDENATALANALSEELSAEVHIHAEASYT